MLTDAAQHHEAMTGSEVDIEESALAQAFQRWAAEERDMLLPLAEKILAPLSDAVYREVAREHKTFLLEDLWEAFRERAKVLRRLGVGRNATVGASGMRVARPVQVIGDARKALGRESGGGGFDVHTGSPWEGSIERSPISASAEVMLDRAAHSGNERPSRPESVERAVLGRVKAVRW
jgi:hypothetical protein